MWLDRGIFGLRCGWVLGRLLLWGWVFFWCCFCCMCMGRFEGWWVGGFGGGDCVDDAGTLRFGKV